MKKELNQIIMFVGFIVVVVGALISALSEDISATLSFASTYLITIFAVTFIFAKNPVVKNFGYALAGFSGVDGIFAITLGSESTMVANVGQIIMFVAAILYFILICLKFFGFVKGEKNNTTTHNDAIEILNGYKALMTDKVVTEEEFEQLKKTVLSNNKDKATSVNDLKKWKKALDQGVITDKEFADIKSSIFKK